VGSWGALGLWSSLSIFSAAKIGILLRPALIVELASSYFCRPVFKPGKNSVSLEALLYIGCMNTIFMPPGFIGSARIGGAAALVRQEGNKQSYFRHAAV
jgi:hypothetical protein